MKKNKAESKVRRILKNNGFVLSSQKDQTNEGVDIVAMKEGEVLLIEVKKANLHNRAWQVDSVSKKQRVLCNTIAIVTPTHVVFQPMKEHLKLCAKNGMRYVTELVGMCKLID
jgi:Holliday junction resolvase-like predicted endonuclease